MNKKINEITKINETIKVCQEWNRKLIEPSIAMSKIWNIFKKENLKEHNYLHRKKRLCGICNKELIKQQMYFCSNRCKTFSIKKEIL